MNPTKTCGTCIHNECARCTNDLSRKRLNRCDNSEVLLDGLGGHNRRLVVHCKINRICDEGISHGLHGEAHLPFPGRFQL